MVSVVADLAFKGDPQRNTALGSRHKERWMGSMSLLHAEKVALVGWTEANNTRLRKPAHPTI